MGNGFTIIEHTADIGLEITGDTVEELFESAAEGMFSILIDLDSIDSTVRHTITVSAAQYEDLLVFWLQELLYQFEVEHYVYRSFSVHIGDSSGGTVTLRSVCGGEQIDRSKHDIATEIKNATYHQLQVTRGANNWHGRVIFDI